jgi:RNA polymerase sigma factor (sigma-70 family)
VRILVETELERFLSSHAQWMLRFARVLTPTAADAEDLTQEALVLAVKHWDKLRAARTPRAYLRRVMVNAYISGRRSTVYSGQLSDHAVIDIGVARVDDRDQATRLLSSLPPRQQAALALRFLEDCSYSDVAAALRCREATARSLVKRGLDTLSRVRDVQRQELHELREA